MTAEPVAPTAEAPAAAPAAGDGAYAAAPSPLDPPAPTFAAGPVAPPSTVAAPAVDASGVDPDADPEQEDGEKRVLQSPFPLPDLREGDGDDAMEQSRDEFTTVYDIIDKMEASLEEAKGSLFFPSQVKVDRDELTRDLDDLKKMLPVQLERASALMREAERRLEGAQTQANAIVASAQSRAADVIKEANEQAQFLAGQEHVTELARQKARTILSTAQTKADRLTRGADEYSTKVMESLRSQLNKMNNDVEAGLNVLYERRKAAAQDMPHLDISDYPESR
ncbi:cell division protein [Bifidobacterium sp. SMA15]|uniref:Cell division protein n=1 Tax=Bifidobacterium platyrrhinorum TaxID=2661628 RepID=A0A6L9SRB2_9BIFI|nr:cell division protein [Bifidobacterium platyrrhinorum]